MSTAAPSSRLGWRLLPAVIAGAVMVIVASVTIDALRSNPGVIPIPGAAGGAPVVRAASIDAPAWDMRVFPVGTRGGLSKIQRRHFEAQRPAVAKIVRKVFGAMAGERGLDEIVALHFTKDAARALARSDVAVPANATRVVIRRRKASIGIQGTPPNTAAAEVTLSAKAEIGSRVVRWSDRATLWLERSKRGWRVIAFDLVRDRS
ncbi:MAG: hypothetical protein ACRDI3_01700 [Actinomycetota bacterium]